jgi:general secretion pathway protein D
MLRACLAFVLCAGAFWSQLPGQTAPTEATPPVGAQSPATAASTSTAPAQNTSKSEKNTKPSPAAEVETGKPIQANTIQAQRKAAKLYLRGVRLVEKERFEEAWGLLKQAVALEPGNSIYAKAAELARQSAVTQLVQRAGRERAGSTGKEGANGEAARLLQQAQGIDPTNPLVLEHLGQMADETSGTRVGTTPNAVLGKESGAGSEQESLADGPIQLEPKTGKQSFHLHNNSRQVVQEVFRGYGIDASVHDSVPSRPIRLDIDDATFAEAAHVLGLVTQTFYEPLDPHRVLVAKDTRENRTQFQRQQMETIYLPGLNDKEMTETINVAKNVFEAQQAVNSPTSGTLTLRAPAKTLAAFNRTMAQLEDGKSQVDLDVKVIQLAHISSRETGTTFFQQTGVYNVFSEINSVLSQNQSLVQQIISAGLVPNASTLANQIEILAILVASGQLTGTPFNQGFLPFGGGLTQSILSPGPATLNMSLNTSDSRVLDDIHLQLADQEEGTFKIGERYPIETSSFSSAALPSIPGISSALTAAASQTVPQIEYQDIGLTFKATPKVMRSNDVALTLDLKIVALGGTSLNDIPILDNQQISGVLTMKAGETAVLLSDLTRTESRALSGLPGVSDIPGLQDVSDIQKNQNVARLLILVTPSLVRNMQPQGHGPMMMVDKSPNAH